MLSKFNFIDTWNYILNEFPEQMGFSINELELAVSQPKHLIQPVHLNNTDG